jgi:hypothetical protein
MPSVVIIIASGTTGRDARWGPFDPQRGTMHPTGTLTKILLNQTTQSHIFEGGTAHADLARGRRRSVTSPQPLRCLPLWRITAIR